MAKARIEIIGDSTSYIRSVKAAAVATDKLELDMKKLAITAKSTADKQIQASVRKDARLRQEISEYRAVAAAAKKGSKEQIIAANLAAQGERSLSRSLGVTAKESRYLAVSASHTEREFGRMTRGALAGSGVFRGMGRSLAFASGGFLALASAASFVRSSLTAAQSAVVTQKSLAAQFKATNTPLSVYQNNIDETTLKLSNLTAFTKDDLTKSFTTIFRGSRNVTESLKDVGVAADIARGRNISLATASVAVGKAAAGSTTSLRRLGIQLPKGTTGLQAIAIAAQRFSGQGAAGTTALDHFNTALFNAKVIIGEGLLPKLNTLLVKGTDWINQLTESGKLQRDVNSVTKAGAATFKLLAAGIGIATQAYKRYSSVVSHIPGGKDGFFQSLFKPFGTIEYFAKRFHLTGAGKPPLSAVQKQIADENAFLRDQRKRGTGTAGPSDPRRRGVSLQGQFNLAELKLARAELTATSVDDRRILSAEAAIVRVQLQHVKTLKGRIALTQQLAGILSQIQGIDQADAQAAKDAAKAARDRRQTALQTAEFKILGLDASGKPFNRLQGLRRELKSIRGRIGGTTSDTKKNRGILGDINVLLFGKHAHELTGQVRDTIRQMLDAINQALGTGTGIETRFKAANTNKLLAGLGLSPDQIRATRARLSQLGPGGTVPAGSYAAAGGGAAVVVHTTFQLDGRTVAVNTTRHQDKQKRRNPPQKRGPHAK